MPRPMVSGASKASPEAAAADEDFHVGLDGGNRRGQHGAEVRGQGPKRGGFLQCAAGFLTDRPLGPIKIAWAEEDSNDSFTSIVSSGSSDSSKSVVSSGSPSTASTQRRSRASSKASSTASRGERKPLHRRLMQMARRRHRQRTVERFEDSDDERIDDIFEEDRALDGGYEPDDSWLFDPPGQNGAEADFVEDNEGGDVRP